MFLMIIKMIFNIVLLGYRMPAPDGTPEDIYRLMLQCWQYQPENRPHFDKIYATMESLVKTLRYKYYDYIKVLLMN